MPDILDEKSPSTSAAITPVYKPPVEGWHRITYNSTIMIVGVAKHERNIVFIAILLLELSQRWLSWLLILRS